MPSDRLTGKASFFTIGGTNIPITKISPKVTRKLADITDSSDYSQTTDMIAPVQIPVNVVVEATIEGRFHKSSIPSVIMANLFNSLSAIPVTFGLDLAPTIWGHGLFDVSDFSTDIPIDDVVTYSATIKSSGAFTPNS